MNIGVVNQSSTVNDLDFHCMVAAAKDQVSNEFAAAWGSERGPVTIQIYSSVSSIPSNYWAMTIVDDPNQTSWFGYHINNSPVSQSIIFADIITGYGCPILYNSSDPTFFTVSSIFCHELLEMIVDPCVNQWWDGPGVTASGTPPPISSYASEICDPVYFDVYQKIVSGDIGMSSPLSSPVTVNVCNFIYPAWRDIYAGSGEIFDQMGLLNGPFTADYGGYMLVRDEQTTGDEFIYGAQFPSRFTQLATRHSRCSNRMKNIPRTRLRPSNNLSRNIKGPYDK